MCCVCCSYFPRWSLETGHIAEVKPTNPPTYLVRDDSGELLRGIAPPIYLFPS